VRFFVLQSHYRSTLDFSNDAVEAASKGLEKLTSTVHHVRDALRNALQVPAPAGIDLRDYNAAFLTAMDDDFNTPQAIAALFDLSREVNQVLATHTAVSATFLRDVDNFFGEHAGRILGLTFEICSSGTTGQEDSTAALMDLLVSIRAEVRAQKLWSLSDRIRDALAQAGFVLEDKREGTRWKRTS
jgi:cysteinyl-tRNA synthetase